jgi:hypothetical protein
MRQSSSSSGRELRGTFLSEYHRSGKAPQKPRSVSAEGKIENETVTVTIQNGQQRLAEKVPNANTSKALQRRNCDRENQSNRLIFLYRE